MFARKHQQQGPKDPCAHMSYDPDNEILAQSEQVTDVYILEFVPYIYLSKALLGNAKEMQKAV